MGGLVTFETLECYRLACALRRRVSRLCGGLPAEERFRLKDQLLRSSRSITANIAEGYGRHHHQENIQFCRQARGSLSESLDHLNVMRDENYLADADYDAIRSDLEQVWKVLNGYIAYLVRCARDGVPGRKEADEVDD